MSIKIEEIDARNLPDEGDPLMWLWKHREKLSEKYPTIESLFDYYDQVGTVEDALARVREKIAERKRLEQETAVK
jgi:hypothetical protein